MGYRQFHADVQCRENGTDAVSSVSPGNMTGHGEKDYVTNLPIVPVCTMGDQAWTVQRLNDEQTVYRFLDMIDN